MQCDQDLRIHALRIALKFGLSNRPGILMKPIESQPLRTGAKKLDDFFNHGVCGLHPFPKWKMERARRFERPTSTLARLRSTPELRPHTPEGDPLGGGP